MIQMSTEYELVRRYAAARAEKEAAKERLKSANELCDNVENELVEWLQARNATATAKYSGLGYAKLMAPGVYASCPKESEELLFSFLRDQGRDDLIKTTVNSVSLSALVKEKLETGEAIPAFISYYIKPAVRIYGGE